MMMTRWDAEKAAELARTAYQYVARTYPPGGPWDAIGRADRRVVEAEERGVWEAYVEALREMCRVAKREAQRRAAA
jgi:hypothetical protein